LVLFSDKERRDREAAEVREEKERRRDRPTILNEYLRNCHTLFYMQLKLADKSKSPTSTTKADGKY